MARYIVRRILLLIVTVLVTSMIIFALTQFLPGDIAKLIKGRDASQGVIEAFREDFGLNDPLPTQYVNWLTGFVTGDWGISFASGNPQVYPLVMERFGNSMILAGFTLLIAIPLSVALGILAALRENTWIDSLVSILSLSVVGLPEFVTGIVLVNIFALGLGWFETNSLISNDQTMGDWIRILVLPSITASLVLIGYVTRMTRAGMIDELKKPYVQTATLKGLPWSQVIIKHVLRNALLPTITVIAISVGWLIGGLVVIENVFTYPGLGSMLVESVKQKNLPVLQAITMIIVVTFALANLIADLLYAILNPRVRLN